MLNKTFALLALVLPLISSAAYSDSPSCQHPYCDGPSAATISSSPNPSGVIYNPQYCYGVHCSPGAYIPGAIDQNGNLATVSNDNTPISAADRLKQELAEVGVQTFTSKGYKLGIVRHIVLFRYATSVTQAQKDEVKRRFLALQNLCRRGGSKYIVSIETGGEISGEGADQGLEQGFIVTFRSQGDRNYYVGQPVVNDPGFYDSHHQTFKDFVGPLLDQNGVVVFDFSVEN